MMAEPSSGDQVGPWRLETLLGRGAFGATWRAVDSLGRVAAVKLISEPPGDELRALAGFSHPAIPALYDAQGAPQPYVAMELAVGRPLSEMLRRGRAPESAALQLCAVMADALAHVHEAGLSHGDVKPENILVDHIGQMRMWLVDFGACGMPGAGTLHYASPERMRGGSSTPAADVYALGLVLWEVIHGALPWFDEGISTALTRRGSAAPASAVASPWVAELLEQMLAPEPELRPSAAIVADTLESHGSKLPQPGGAALRRRAGTVHVAVPAVEERILRWVADGGCLGVVGAPGTGRTHSLRRAEVELRAGGLRYLRLEPSSFPWQAARQALRDDVLSGPVEELPDEPDASMRARMVAAQLARRAGGSLWILVDDLERHSSEVVHLLQAITEQDGLHLLVCSQTVSPLVNDVCMLQPMDLDTIERLVLRVLGGGLPRPRLETLHAAIGGLPGRWIDVLARLCDARVLLRRARRWLVDGPRLDDVLAELPADGEVESIELVGREREVAGLVALSEGELTVGAIAAAIGAPVSSLGPVVDALVLRDLVVVADGEVLRLASQGRRAVIAKALGADAARLHGALVRVMASAPATGPLALAHHLHAAADPALITAHGPEALRGGTRVDPQHAARLALGMWACAPSGALSGPVVASLAAAGRIDEAREIAEAVLADTQTPPSLDLLRSLARIRIHFDEAPDEALSLLSQAQDLARAQGGDARPSLELRLLEAQAHFAAERFGAAESVARAACARPPGASVESQEAWVTLHGTWAQAVHRLGDIDAAIKILDEVPDEVARGRPARALLEGMRGRLLWHAGRIREAADVLEAGASANAGLPALQRARMLNNAGLASYQCGDRRAALERWEGALLLCERLGARSDVIRLNVNLCVGYTEAGRWERARRAGQAAHDDAREAEAHELQAMAAGNMGDLAFHRGEFDEAERWYAACDALAEAHGLDGEKVEQARRVAELAVRRRQPEAATLARSARELAEASGDTVEAGRARMLQLLCAARDPATLRSSRDDLERAVGAILDDFKRQGLGGHLAVARSLAAEVELELERPAEALKIIDSVAMYAVEVGHVPLRRRAEELRTLARERVQADPRAGRFERMLNLATSVAREQDPQRLLDSIAQAGLELMDGDRCFVMLMENGVPRVERIHTAEGARLAHAQQRPSTSVVDQVIAQRRPVIANDILERGDLREARSVAALALRAAMCVPMQDGDDLLGMIYVDSQRQSERQLSEATHLMRALASHAAVALSHAKHMADIRMRAREAAEVAHDIRSPLASVTSMLQEMQDEQEDYDEGADPRLQEMLGLLARAVTMAEQLLDNRRPPAQRFLLSAAVAQLCQSMDRRAKVARKRVVAAVAPGVELVGIQDELIRVVANLVNNALKFSPEGGIVTVRLDEDADQVTIRVSDQGPGVPAELLPRLFERGVKSADERGGHGLGLAIVDRLVREAGGTVSVANPAAGGACFTVVLPRAVEADTAPAAVGQG